MGKCSMSPVIREMQINFTVRYHHAPPEGLQRKRLTILLTRMLSNWNSNIHCWQECKKVCQLFWFCFLSKLWNFRVVLGLQKSFLGGSDGRELACNEGDVDATPGLGRSPGEGNGNLLRYSCRENSVDRGAWWATVHGVTQRQAWLSSQHFHFFHFTVDLPYTPHRLPYC